MPSSFFYKQEKFFHQKLNRNKLSEYTKMVNAISRRRKSGLDSDPIRQRMLRERHDHARRQEHDYSHVFRPKSRLDLIRLSMIIVGIEFAYSAETAFVAPILLSIGIEHKNMTMVWAISPFLGFFLSPVLGSISDRCRSRFGRRRPLIFCLGICIIIGLIFAPMGKHFAEVLSGDDYTEIYSNGTFIDGNLTNFEYATVGSDRGYYLALTITIVGTLLLDFSADNCQTPSRAYLLDVCISEEHGKALSTFTIMAGAGGCIGYTIGAIDWNQTILANIFHDNIKTVFAIVTIVFFFCIIITLTSFREIPLRLLESDEMMRPLTHVAVKKEKEKIKALEGLKQPTTTAKFMTENEHNGLNGNTYVVANDQQHIAISNGSISSSSDDDEDEIDDIMHVSFMTYLKSIVFMPKALRILCLTNCFAWMGQIVYSLYFTDFVGESVFNGDPSADPSTEQYKAYEAGVRFGCVGMAIYALSCALYSMIIEKLIKKFTAKKVYIASLLCFAVAMAILGKYPTRLGVLAFSVTAGTVYATLFTIPFLLVAQYHAKGTFKHKSQDPTGSTEKIEPPPSELERGLGLDCGIVGSCLFVAQFTMSLSIGPFITLLDSTSAIMYAASFFSLLSAVSSCFVVYMDL